MRMRRRKAQWLVSGMLSLSLLIVGMGIYTSTRTESISITGYLSGIIVSVIITFWNKCGFFSLLVCLLFVACLYLFYLVLYLTMRPNAILDLLHIPWGTRVYSGLNEDSISSSEMKMYLYISFSRTII